MAIFYSFFIYPLLHSGFWIMSFFNPKIREGFSLRRHKSWIQRVPWSSSMASTATTSSTSSGSLGSLEHLGLPAHLGPQIPVPTIWFHVASGEFEYAKPVIRDLKKNTRCKILVTYFSPSVVAALKAFPDVDLFVPMPWDTAWNWKEFLEHYRPNCLAIARTDTWPQMIWQTKKRNIPSILFSATLPSTSGRVASFWGRLLYGSIVEELSHISCVTDYDRDNFLRLDPKLSITVDGDTRFDQVSFRLQNPKSLKFSFSNSTYVTQNPLIFVAGSTWPEDEKIILPGLKLALENGMAAIIAPHEPREPHLKNLEQQFHSLGISDLQSRAYIKRYSEISKGHLIEAGEVILVDQVGILAELYQLAQISFVGGSFKKSVHSVMEPAAAGSQIVFGPYYTNSREAIELKKLDLASEITSSMDLEKFLESYKIQKPLLIQKKRENILQFVKERTGVSQKISDWIRINGGLKSGYI